MSVCMVDVIQDHAVQKSGDDEYPADNSECPDVPRLRVTPSGAKSALNGVEYANESLG